MKGAGVGGAIAKSSGAFFFIWTLLALGVTALFSVILSVRGLWEHLPRRTDVQHKQGAMKRCSRSYAYRRFARVQSAMVVGGQHNSEVTVVYIGAP